MYSYKRLKCGYFCSRKYVDKIVTSECLRLLDLWETSSSFILIYNTRGRAKKWSEFINYFTYNIWQMQGVSFLNIITPVIEGFRRGRHVAWRFLGCSPASIFGMQPTFREHLGKTLKMGQTSVPETLVARRVTTQKLSSNIITPFSTHIL
jgi:hypothetical protein